MAETAESRPVMSSRRIVQECVEFARQNGANASQGDQAALVARRATPRKVFTHHLVYSPHPELSEDCTKPARMLDVSLGGIGLLCCETLAERMEIHIRLPLLDGKNAWVKGKVVYCCPGEEHYLVGVAFILDQD